MTTQLRLIVIGVAVALVAAAIFFIYKRGNDDALSGVERQNSRAAEKSIEASLSLSECRKRGGVYQFDTGKCRLLPRNSGS